MKCFPFLHIALVHARLLSPQKAMAPHSSTLAWKIPWMEEPGRLQSIELLRVVYFSLSCIGGGNGNPLQCSCLENPREGGAWWAAVSGVAQSRTRLKGRSSSSSCSVMSNFLHPHGLQPTRLLCPWTFPGKNTGVGHKQANNSESLEDMIATKYVNTV